MDVTPTFYTEEGEAFVGDAFQMQPAEVKTVDLKSIMPNGLAKRRDLGGMTLSYTGVSLEMWGQLRLQRVRNGGSIDVTFVNLPDRRSNERKAVWWVPEGGESVIALGNLAGTPAKAMLRFSNGDSQEIEIPAFGTRLARRSSVRREYEDQEGIPESVTINSSGPTGSVIPAGAITSSDGTFTSSIRFYDTENVVQQNLYATNFRLRKIKPRMLLQNTGPHPVAVTPRFLPAPGDPNSFIDLPTLTLDPDEISDVDLRALKAAVKGDSKFKNVSVQIINNGEPGSLIGALYGNDTSNGLTYDVPLRDFGAIRTSTGSYPWRLDHDVSTIVSITNVAPVSSRFVVQINYPGGPYLLDPQEVEAGETAIFDLRRIRDEQIPDRNGRKIPRKVTGGQFRWFIHGGGSGRLIGRVEMLSQTQHISSSYSCNDPCPPVFGDAFFDIPVVYLGVADTKTQTPLEIDYDSYGNQYGPFSPSVTGWSCSDWNVISMNWGQITGIAPGYSSTAATVQYQHYTWDGLNCYDQGTNYSDADGEARIPSVDIEFTGSGVPLASGTPPPNSWPSYVKSVTMRAVADFDGGEFVWSTTSNKVTLSNANSETVTVNSAAASASRNDVVIKVTYTIEGESATDEIQTTVQRPAKLIFASYGAANNGPETCPSGEQGKVKDINWQLQDHLTPAANIEFQIPGSNVLTANQGQNGCGLTLTGTPPSDQAYTFANGIWPHHYHFCTASCPCSTQGVQQYTFNGFTINLPFVFTCSGITVDGK